MPTKTEPYITGIFGSFIFSHNPVSSLLSKLPVLSVRFIMLFCNTCTSDSCIDRKVKPVVALPAKINKILSAFEVKGRWGIRPRGRPLKKKILVIFNRTATNSPKESGFIKRKIS